MNYGQSGTSNFACTQHASSLTFTSVTTLEHMCNNRLSLHVFSGHNFEEGRLVSAPDGATQSPIIILSTIILSEIEPHTQLTQVFNHEIPQPTAQQKIWDTTNSFPSSTHWAGQIW